MLFTESWAKNNQFILLRLWILQICCVYCAIAGAILNTTQLYEIRLNDLTLNQSSSFKSIATNNITVHRNGTRLHNHREPILYVDVKTLYKPKVFRKEKVNLILLPGLALTCFITMVCFRICKWKRDDMKFKTRGCSYDVTNFVILADGDSDYNSVEIVSSYDTETSYASMVQKSVYKTYDTITSYKSLQYRIDAQMFTSASTYNTYLKSPIRKTGNFDFEISVHPSKNKNSKENLQKKEVVPRKIPGTRFSIVPALDNYARLKREGAQRSMTSSPNTPSETEWSAPGTPTSFRRSNRHKVSFTQKSRVRESGHPMKSILTCNKYDKEIQVSLPRKTKQHKKPSNKGEVAHEPLFTSNEQSNSCDVKGQIEMKNVVSTPIKSTDDDTDLTINYKTFGKGRFPISNESELLERSSENIMTSTKPNVQAVCDLNIPQNECSIVVEADVHNYVDVTRTKPCEFYDPKMNGLEFSGTKINGSSRDQSLNACVIKPGTCIKRLHPDYVSNNVKQSYGDTGFKPTHLHAPANNGFIAISKKFENSLEELSNKSGTTPTRVKRPRSLSPLHHVKISPKDVHLHETKYDKNRKFSLGALYEPTKNGSDSFLSGRKSFSSVRELISKSKPSTTDYCGSSESLSLLSSESDNLQNDGSTSSLIIS